MKKVKDELNEKDKEIADDIENLQKRELYLETTFENAQNHIKAALSRA